MNRLLILILSLSPLVADASFYIPNGAVTPKKIANTGSVKTSGYTLTSYDSNLIVNASGGGFTINLPTPVGITGKIYKITRNDSNMANVVTLSTAAGNIKGYASVTLNTQWESWEVLSDGSNWNVITHYAETPAASYSPSLAGGFGGASTSIFWWRKGHFLYVMGRITAGTVSGGNASMTIPSNMNIDSSIISAAHNWALGSWVTQNTASSAGNIITNTNGSTTLVYFAALNAGQTSGVPTTPNAMGGNGGIYTFTYHVPISGWYE